MRMIGGTRSLHVPARFESGGRLSRRRYSRSFIGPIFLMVCMAAAILIFYDHPAAPSGSENLPGVAALAPAPAPAPANTYVELLDPTYSLRAEPVSFAQSAPLGAEFEFASSTPEGEAVATEPVNEAMSVPVPPLPPVAELEPDIPSPAPRPPELGSPAAEGPVSTPARQIASQRKTALLASTPPDRRGFFERLFGASQSAGPGLAYAAPEDGMVTPSRRLTSASSPSADRWTAVYDISAHVVYMPDGTRLEAHSGLGSRLDDPRYVQERMHGPTPPHVYELTPREQLFHGVQALRLNPIGGGDIYGRTGLLAHTYMLGPNGDSNGCVSFRNYNAFLQAYMKGEVKRLLVVARL